VPKSFDRGGEKVKVDRESFPVHLYESHQKPYLDLLRRIPVVLDGKQSSALRIYEEKLVPRADYGSEVFSFPAKVETLCREAGYQDEDGVGLDLEPTSGRLELLPAVKEAIQGYKALKAEIEALRAENEALKSKVNALEKSLKEAKAKAQKPPKAQD